MSLSITVHTHIVCMYTSYNMSWWIKLYLHFQISSTIWQEVYPCLFCWINWAKIVKNTATSTEKLRIFGNLAITQLLIFLILKFTNHVLCWTHETQIFSQTIAKFSMLISEFLSLHWLSWFKSQLKLWVLLYCSPQLCTVTTVQWSSRNVSHQ